MDRDYALIRQLPLRMAAEKKLHSEFWVNQMINDCRRLSTDSRISFDRALRETAKQLESYAKQRQAEEAKAEIIIAPRQPVTTSHPTDAATLLDAIAHFDFGISDEHRSSTYATPAMTQLKKIAAERGLPMPVAAAAHKPGMALAKGYHIIKVATCVSNANCPCAIAYSTTLPSYTVTPPHRTPWDPT